MSGWCAKRPVIVLWTLLAIIFWEVCVRLSPELRYLWVFRGDFLNVQNLLYLHNISGPSSRRGPANTKHNTHGDTISGPFPIHVCDVLNILGKSEVVSLYGTRFHLHEIVPHRTGGRLSWLPVNVVTQTSYNCCWNVVLTPICKARLVLLLTLCVCECLPYCCAPGIQHNCYSSIYVVVQLARYISCPCFLTMGIQ